MKQEEYIAKKIERDERNSILANERTYAAWVRTGLTTFATGLGVERFLYGVIPAAVIRTTSMTLFSCSVMFFFLAAWRYRQIGTRLVSEKCLGAPMWVLAFLSILLIINVLLALIGVWVIEA